MTLRVIGAGAGRTGTETLRRALETLGFAPCHHMFALRDDPALVPPWLAVARREASPDWDALFEGFEAQVDWPGAAFWREIAAHFAEARVILSVRDAAGWYDSLAATILPFVAARGRHSPPHRNDMAEITERLLRRELGDPFDRDRAMAAYERRLAEVREAIPPERLLELPMGAGWGPLCEFLGRPVPDAPYPSGNTAAEFRARIARGLVPNGRGH